MYQEIIEDTKLGMERSLQSLDAAFNRIRTGRASPALLDDIKVDYYDTLTPLSQLANISVEDAKTIAIIPHKLAKVGTEPQKSQLKKPAEIR